MPSRTFWVSPEAKIRSTKSCSTPDKTSLVPTFQGKQNNILVMVPLRGVLPLNVLAPRNRCSDNCTPDGLVNPGNPKSPTLLNWDVSLMEKLRGNAGPGCSRKAALATAWGCKPLAFEFSQRDPQGTLSSFPPRPGASLTHTLYAVLPGLCSVTNLEPMILREAEPL